LLND